MNKEFNGFMVIDAKKEIVLLADDVLKRMILHINKECDLNLTTEQIGFNIDSGSNRFYLNVNEELISEEETEKCKYNLQEWFTTFDQLMYEIFEIELEDQINFWHEKYEDNDDYLIVTFREKQ